MVEHVLVLVPRPPSGGLGSAGGEALGAGRQLASELGVPLVCAVIGHGVEAAAAEAAELGSDRVLVADAQHLAGTAGDAVVLAAVEAVRVAEARITLISHGPDAPELAPRLAVRLDGGSVMGVTELRPGADGELEVAAAVFGGAARAVYRFGADGPCIVGVAPAIAEVPPREAGRTAEVTSLAVEPPAEERVRLLQPAAAAEGPRLEDARVIVTGGRGLQSGESYQLIRDLAAALGGMPGASRAIVDNGWAPPTEQIGLTGKLVTPELYLAFGISGASQHMVGCANARVIVAVNNDPDAPIFKYAHFGIVDDCLEVLSELIRLRSEATSADG